MRVKLRGVRQISITGDFIRLDSLLKYASLASTGGEAKILIQNGGVYVDGVLCQLRGKKIKPGETVRAGGSVLLVRRANGIPENRKW